MNILVTESDEGPTLAMRGKLKAPDSWLFSVATPPPPPFSALRSIVSDMLHLPLICYFALPLTFVVDGRVQPT